VKTNRDKPARDIIASLYQAVLAHGQNNPPLDDVTAVLVKVG
jgi:hypothetical protein